MDKESGTCKTGIFVPFIGTDLHLETLHDWPRPCSFRQRLRKVVIILVRLLWRLTHRVPQWQRTAAKASHVVLYVCIIVMPLSGYTGGGRRPRSRSCAAKRTS